MPTALDQAYWTARLCSLGRQRGRRLGPLGPGLLAGSAGRFAAYLCAWVNTFGWWTLAASQVAFMAEFVLAMRIILDADGRYLDPGWLRFVYVAITVALTVVNLVACCRPAVLPAINRFVGVCFAGLFFAFGFALPASVASPSSRPRLSSAAGSTRRTAGPTASSGSSALSRAPTA